MKVISSRASPWLTKPYTVVKRAVVDFERCSVNVIVVERTIWVTNNEKWFVRSKRCMLAWRRPLEDISALFGTAPRTVEQWPYVTLAWSSRFVRSLVKCGIRDVNRMVKPKEEKKNIKRRIRRRKRRSPGGRPTRSSREAACRPTQRSAATVSAQKFVK